jgi:ribosomal-protein-alanine N-acetyltransferase
LHKEPTISIRLATRDDIAAIVCLERQTALAAHWTEEQYRQLLQTADGPTRLVLVACRAPAEGVPVDAPEVQGFLVASQAGPEWELENIVVSASVWRQGIGQGLLGEMRRRAREAGSEAVFLEVRESNRAARSLYEKSGFRETGRRKAYYQNPIEDAILYRVSLR